METGARIIPFCGFDSIPSDISALLANQTMWARHGEKCARVTAAFSIRGGFNGGTLASMFNLMATGQARCEVADPFLLNPPGTRATDTAAHRDPAFPVHDEDFKAWLGPFFMAPINTRVVRRTAALLGYADDYSATRSICGSAVDPAAAHGRNGALSVGSVHMVGQAAIASWPLSAQLAQALAPGPGEGPSEASMDGGSFRCQWVGHSAGGHTVRGLVADQGDPGNRATTKMLCESALALAYGSATNCPAWPPVTAAC
jgi:short subunit dehydrogenase-like uncharacterized protein